MIRVAIAENQDVYRFGLERILSIQEDIAVVAQLSSSKRLYEFINVTWKTIILFSSTLRCDLNILTRYANVHGCKLVIIAEDNESLRHYAAQGLDGVIFRDISREYLTSCIYAINAGQSYLHEKSGHSPTDEIDYVGERVVHSLAPMELKIVSLILEGRANKAIGEMLNTSEQVVKNYLHAIYGKVGVSSRLELALFAMRHPGLLESATGLRRGRVDQLNAHAATL